MNTHDKYELPPLFLPGAIGKYTKKEMQDYAREAIEAYRQRRGEPVAWTLTQQEVIALAEELIVGANTLGGMDDDGLECDVRLMVLMPGTIVDDDGKTNGQPILAFCLEDYPEEGVYPIDPTECRPPADPQPAEPDYKALYFKEQALRMEAEACADMIRGDDPVKDGRVGKMTPKRAAFFLGRFKRDEKMLGPNEQRALDYAIEVLEAEPVKVPSDEEVIEAVIAYGKACAGLITATERQMRLHDIRALLARYGQPAQPAASAEPTQKDLDAFIQRAGFTHGWENLESWARRMAEQAVKELSVQPGASAEPAELGPIRVGNLPTMNQDEYPGLGDWWVQLRIGSDGDEVLARVYGDTPEQARSRAVALAAPVAAQPHLYDGDTLTAAYMAGQDARRPTQPADRHRETPTVEPKLDTLPVTPEEEEEWRQLEKNNG
ncbi:hypothetical protein CSC67_08445 [Pusillimonas caeni]|uniref:hypothetical protein n=1 Tax=Pusillimonas caeni TaxID=1348472 RepID=UPI000E5A0A8E|nr:hypothetical protein [Pusillimonas caeni]TFL14172.1 hypothetical protein CSC67_08445 [Pusillimonas caeni]